MERIKQKGESKCILWKSLQDLILAHPDTKKKVDVLVLSIYGLIIFPKALGHIDEAVSDLFDRLDRRVTPVPAILSKTFRSLNACRRTRVVRYTTLLILRQYRSRQLILVTQGLDQCEFSYKGDNYMKKIQEMSDACNQTRQMKRFVVGQMTTP
ncbi:hypothetical protein Goklo_025051 [Gossypium klotzschianum]|uniref:DUF7745 domain-containing protein n=1 Tax=Gossypium klotzschianum TaxID=34286 RepID=A0A7J8WEC9_9ROSI|nr:hypothetical protein [Gossypium klotzschianum]